VKAPASPAPVSVLVADDNPDILGMFHTLLGAGGPAGAYTVDAAASGDAALALLEENVYDLVITDLKMGGPDGLEVLRRVKAHSPATTVVIMTGYASLDTALEAIRGGAYDYLTKPFTLEEIEVLLGNVTDRIRTRREKALLERELEDAYRLISALQARGTGAGEGPEPVAAGPGDGPSEVRESSRRSEALAAYRAAAWTPERAAERLSALFGQGALSRDAYERLTRLIPRGPTVA